MISNFEIYINSYPHYKQKINFINCGERKNKKRYGKSPKSIEKIYIS